MQMAGLRFLLGYTLIVTLLGNWLLALLRVDPVIVKTLIATRDLLIFLIPISILVIAPGRKYDKYVLVMALFSFLVLSIFSTYALIIDGVDIAAIFLQLRILSALPLLILIVYMYEKLSIHEHSIFFNALLNYSIFAYFGICFIESAFLLSGNHFQYLQYVNFNSYMEGKGTQASIGAGLFDGYRLLTPAFNPSVGGAILAFISATLLRKGRSLMAIGAAFLCILTMSKTGILILAILLSPVRYIGLVSLVSFVAFTVLSFSSVSFMRDLITDQMMLQNLASVAMHLDGLKSGYQHILSPLGIGNAGTISQNLSATEIGRESSFGMSAAILGPAYFLILALCWTACRSKTLKIDKFFLFFIAISAVNEATGPVYFWITVFLVNSFLHAKHNNRIAFL